MNQGTQDLIGHPVAQAVDKLGFPDSQSTIMGRTVYVWRTGGPLDAPGSRCEVRVVVDEGGIVTRADWRGGEIGCDRYHQRLGHPRRIIPGLF